mgnify:CR=1 FL=1
MKLNGKFYFKKKFFEDQIDSVMLELELLNFKRISTDLFELTNSDVETTLAMMTASKNDIISIFDKEKYLDIDSLVRIIDGMVYDPKNIDVALYKYGAYGIKTRAADDAVCRYAFNVCFNHLSNKIKKLNNLQ